MNKGFELVFASRNKGKYNEIKRMMPRNINLLSLNDLNFIGDIKETGETLKQNAKIKSDFIFNNFGVNCFADDTGLEIDSLNGMPGVYSARFAGKTCNSNENIEKVWKLLAGYENTDAKFKSILSLNINGKTVFFEGKIDGKIIFNKRGTNGFGYDSIFVPNGYNKTFAELNLVEKNQISHRSEALKRLIIFLDKQKYL
ncbi:MAG: RdgB/HAM1 family non-canonical purine NTP pyrophosphatase [Flavobacteriales bacterium]|nr:MAG: RdgB/HAM1 family non-canonical purine NTP pyrophosphatase [Flavobacteriales bacterium TMED96]RZP12250.1 MAG: RdgB/HAM1 family non-canonical purine NTP pyrophosphatase [Flavobacteriales bacterium]|tara:strand:- start:2446 stop:3042 length:597 start_codon:yes stop_codon:yes gene_type:complete